MSADNGIYIGEFEDSLGQKEWRVIHAQNIEDLEHYPKGSYDRHKTIHQFFGEASVRYSLDDAYILARQMYDDIIQSDFPIIEYGIVNLGKIEF